MQTMTRSDGLALRVRADDPASTPPARIVLIHGITNREEIFDDLAAWMNARA